MSCLGVLFSVDQITIELLKKTPSEEERADYVREILETNYFENHQLWVAELNKSWDALHRSLTDGKLAWDNGEFPLNQVILGGEILCSNGDYIIVLKAQEQIAAIATAVNQVSEEQLRERYFRIDPEEYDDAVDEEDFAGTWAWFEDSKEFWQLAADENRSVLFTVDQ
ncbi:MAG: YfbM family protein [Janthinobacterium lividum]